MPELEAPVWRELWRVLESTPGPLFDLLLQYLLWHSGIQYCHALLQFLCQIVEVVHVGQVDVVKLLLGLGLEGLVVAPHGVVELPEVGGGEVADLEVVSSQGRVAFESGLASLESRGDRSGRRVVGLSWRLLLAWVRIVGVRGGESITAKAEVPLLRVIEEGRGKGKVWRVRCAFGWART